MHSIDAVTFVYFIINGSHFDLLYYEPVSHILHKIKVAVEKLLACNFQILKNLKFYIEKELDLNTLFSIKEILVNKMP